MRFRGSVHLLLAVAVLIGSLALYGCPKRPEVMQAAPAPAGPAAATAPGAENAVTEERAKELAGEYAEKYLPGFTVEKVLPFTGRNRMTMYSVELKGPNDELRVLHVNPFGTVMPFGGPWRHGT